MKISFLVMTRKGYFALKVFIETLGSTLIDCVIAARDNNVDHDYFQEIKTICIDNDVSFYNRTEGHTPQGDFVFVISWKWLLDHHNGNIIIFHDSLLPRYRGFAPLVSSLINGESKIGVTALLASAEYDRGNIILQKSQDISYPLKIALAIDLISKLYSELVIEIGRTLLEGRSLISRLQDEKNASYSLWLDEMDYQINWYCDSTYIKRFIDSVGYPYKGASSLMNGRRVRILDSEVVDDVLIENRVPGKVLFLNKGVPIVVCGKGLIKLTQISDAENTEQLLPLRKFRTRFE